MNRHQPAADTSAATPAAAADQPRPASKSIATIAIVLAICVAIALAGSQASVKAGGALDNLSLFAWCAGVGLALHWLMFIPAYIFQTERYFDLTGSLSFIATVLLAVLAHPDRHLRGLLIAALVAIWALRLGTFLFIRVKASGGDSRFETLMPNFWRYLLTWTLGGAWVFLTLAAGLAAITSDGTGADAGSGSDAGSGIDAGSIGWLFYLGLGIWILGFGLEVTADRQKTRFRRQPENAGRFISSGVWAWSRHPNYLGEMTLWIGIAIMSVPALEGWSWVTLVSPVFVIFLLTRVSGVNLLEAQGKRRWGDDPAWQKYKATTPVLVPRLQRRTG